MPKITSTSWRSDLYEWIARSLRFAERNGWNALPRTFFRLASRTPISDARIRSFHTRVYGDDQISWHQPENYLIFRHFGRRPSLSHTAPSLLADAERITVIVDQDASLPEMLGSEAYSDKRFDFYAFSKLTRRIQSLGLSQRSEVHSLRGLYNGMTHEGEEDFLTYRSIANMTIQHLQEHMPERLRTARLQDSLCATLETIISQRAASGRCITEAILRSPPDQPVLVISHKDGLFADVATRLALAAEDFPAAGFAVLFNGSSRDAKAYARLYEGRKNTPMKSTHFDESGLATTIERLHRACCRSATGITTSLRSHGAVAKTLFIYGETGIAAYQVALNELLSALTCSDPSTIDILVASQSKTKDFERKVRENLNERSPASSIMILGMDLFQHAAGKFGVSNGQVRPFARCVASGIDRDDFSKMARAAIERFVEKDLPWTLFSYEVGRNLAEAGTYDVALATGTRHWLSRCVAAGWCDSRDAPDLIDVQCLNLVPHPKYTTPMATHATAIDQWNADILSSYLNFPNDRVRVCGAPQFDALRREVLAIDEEQARSRFGFAVPDRVILFASQLQPMSLMEDALSPILDVISKAKDLKLLIRLHPREDEGRLSAYRSFVKRHSSAHRVAFSIMEPVSQVIAASDLCVTFYSNLAREMNDLGYTALVPKYTGWEPPIDIVSSGIAMAVRSTEDVEHHIYDALSKGVMTPDEGASNAQSVIDFAVSISVPPKNQETPDVENMRIVVGPEIDELALLDALAPCHDYTFFGNAVTLSEIANASGREAPKSASLGDLEKTGTANAVVSAEKAARWMAADLRSRLEPWPQIVELLGSCEDALWLRLRASLIRDFQQVDNIESDLRTLDSSYVVNVATTDNDLLEAIQNIVENSNVFEAVGLARETGTAHESGRHMPFTSIDASARATLDKLDKWISSSDNRTPASDILISTDWSLKTVPPTLQPPIALFVEEGRRVAILNILERDAETIRRELSGNIVESVDIKSVQELAKHVPFSMRRARHLGTMWFNSLWRTRAKSGVSDLELCYLKHRIRELCLEVFRVHLPELVSVYRYCTHALANPPSVSLACPGRQWHSRVCHAVAENIGSTSVTIQNAYMTSGYTYTAPNAKHVTAIDNWSADLLTDRYGVPADALAVTSTPRFDRLSRYTAEDRVEARKRLGLADDQKLVLFAAQVGREDDTLRIIGALAGLDHVHHPNLRVAIRLHPRSSAEEREAVRDSLGKAGSNIMEPQDKASLDELLLASDIVITQYSNVGVEAAALRKHVIIVNFGDRPHPIPLETFGIGAAAKSEAQLLSIIDKYLSDPEFAAKVSEDLQRFLDLNPCLRDGSSTESIAQLVSEALN